MGAKLSAPQRYETNEEVMGSPQSQPHVLFISTHGRCEGKFGEYKFKAPFNMKKINAVNYGTCNFLNDQTATNMAENVIELIKNDEIKELESGSGLIQSNLIQIDPRVKDNVPRDAAEDAADAADDAEALRKYEWQTNKPYEILTAMKGELFQDKTYDVFPSQRNTGTSPYFDVATLLNEYGSTDLIQEMLSRTTRVTTTDMQTVYLEKLLYHIRETRPHIADLIIIDLTCSGTEGETPRKLREINRGRRLSSRKRARRQPPPPQDGGKTRKTRRKRLMRSTGRRTGRRNRRRSVRNRKTRRRSRISST